MKKKSDFIAKLEKNILLFCSKEKLSNKMKKLIQNKYIMYFISFSSVINDV